MMGISGLHTGMIVLDAQTKEIATTLTFKYEANAFKQAAVFRVHSEVP